MNVLPVIQRELRVQARQAFTYWLRVTGAGGVLAIAAYFALRIGLLPNSGSELFSCIHGMLHVSIWLVVPLLTADCVSRERREGTIGLLFLTPLKAGDIILAKGAVHGFRAATLLMAAAPVAMLPALVGGVGWHQILASLALNAAAASLALGAGMLGSCWSKSWVRSIIMSYVFAALFASLFCQALMASFSFGLGRSVDTSFERGLQLAVGINPEFYMSAVYYRMGRSIPTRGASAQMSQAVLTASTNMFLLSTIALLCLVVVAALVTKRSWQERASNPIADWFQRKLCTPMVMVHFLKQWMHRTLERNPIGWLERRSWSGRVVIWGWLAVMVSLYSAFLTNPRFFLHSFDPLHVAMGTALLSSMAFNSSGSFRRERETRVLELLLVSPMSEAQLIRGRLRGLWGQFFPSLVLLLAGWSYLSASLGSFAGSFPHIVGMAVSFIAIPVIGLYFSLVCRNFLSSLIWTVLIGMVFPSNLLAMLHVAMAVMYWHRGVPQDQLTALDFICHPAILQLALAAALYLNLHRRLVGRRFATEST